MSVEAFHRRVIEPGGPGWAAPVRWGLAGLAWLYAGAVAWRNRRYDRRGPVFHPPLPTVSVGNLTVGGAGKTPLVMDLARRFLERGLTPAILSRGYKAWQAEPPEWLGDQAPSPPSRGDQTREAPSAERLGDQTPALPRRGHERRDVYNDEHDLLRRRCPGAILAPDPDRVRSARRVCQERQADVILLDDGFQHRRLGRDLDIVLIDATRPFGFDRLLPRGLLREPAPQLRRAHLIILTRADQADSQTLQAIHRRLHRVAPEVPVISARHAPRSLYPLTALLDPPLASRDRPTEAPLAPDAPLTPEALRGQDVLAFAAIGNPHAFARTLESLGARLVETRWYPDHYRYRAEDVIDLLDETDRFPADRTHDRIITTEKDAVKLARVVSREQARRIFVLGVTIDFLDAGNTMLETCLDRLLATRDATPRGPCL